MSDLIVCPRCGAALPHGPAPFAGEAASADVPGLLRDDAPAVPLLASGSNDDNFRAQPPRPIKPMAVSPDPILGQFVANRDIPPIPPSIDAFPRIDLGAPAAKAEDQGEAEDLDEDGPAAGTPWATVVLASYASASTLALGWLLLTGRARDARPDPPTRAIEARPDPGRQAGLSREVEPPGPLPEGRVAAIGQALKVGALEVTPIDVVRGDVSLRRFDFSGRPEVQEGGKGAFVLRLRLRNLSEDQAFAPVDQAFVRDRGGVVDSFVEAKDGSKIYPYPLAVESELSIVGQDFAALRPGESRAVTFASAPDAPGDDQGPFLWRLRLRVGVDQVESIGVRWPTTPPARDPAEKG